MADVFVFYSRRDAEFVDRLVSSVSDHGKQVWVDTEAIADADVFPEAIKHAIEGSDAFLFVITPGSVHSAYCENEVEYARDLNKRIVPVLRELVPDSELHEEIRDRNWIPFTEEADFDAGLARLLGALDTDLESVKAHTRWLVKALEWDAEGRDKSFLLRGSELRAAEAWLASRPEDADPAPTQLQREYLLASREAAARRQRAMMGGAVAIAAVSIGLLIFALISRGQAVSERVSARAQALAAESQAQLANDPEISLILGMRAVRTQATSQTLFALRAALDASPLERAVPTIANPGSCGLNSGLAAAVSPDGRQIAEGACTGLVRIFDAATGRVLWSKNIGDQVNSLVYSPSGSALALATSVGASIVNVHTGAIIASTPPSFSGGGAAQGSLAYSPDGRTLATDSYTGLTIGPAASLGSYTTVSAPLGGSMAFSQDGRLLFAAGTDASVRVYDVGTGHQVRRILGPQASNSGLDAVAVSPDGKSLAIAYPVNAQDSIYAVSIYGTATWRKEFTLMTLPQVQISALAFSPDGTRLAIGAEDGTAGVWSVPTRQELVAYQGPTAAIDSIQFTPDGDSVLTASNDGVARLWRAIGVEQSFQTLPLTTSPQQIAFDGDRIEASSSSQPVVYSTPIAGERAPQRVTFPHVQTVVLSADGRLALGIGTPGAPLMIWDARTGRLVRRVTTTAVISANDSNETTFAWNDASVVLDQNVGTGSGAVVLSLTTGRTVSLQSPAECQSLPESFAFSRDDRRVAGAYFCGYADVWDTRTGALLRQVNEGGEVSGVDLSPDGSRLLVSSWDARATIWSVASGRQLVNLIGDTRGLQGAAFSPDGSLVATSSLDDTVRIWNARTGQALRVLAFPDAQGPPVFNASGNELAAAEADPAPGAPDIVRVFDTCPGCTNARQLLALAAPRVTKQLTVLERTVVGSG